MNNKCDGKPIVKSRYIGYGSIGLGAHDWFTVYCDKCNFKTDEYPTEEKALLKWHERHDIYNIDFQQISSIIF